MFLSPLSRGSVMVSYALYILTLMCFYFSAGTVLAGWQHEPIEEIENFYDTDIKLGSGSEVWIAYGGSQLYIAHYSDGSWSHEVVDDGGDVGDDPSMAIDSKGYPHISYKDYSNQSLKYAKYNGTNWEIETVHAADWSGNFSSIALDSANNPHIAYYRGSELNYAYFDGATWVITRVDDETPCRYMSLKLSPANNEPRISYYSNSTLKYAYLSGGTWHKETVDSTGETGWHTSLVFDDQQNPIIAYLMYDSNGDHELKLARHNGTSWDLSTIPGPASAGEAITLKIAPDGYLHMSHRDNYYYQDETGWHYETVLYGNSNTSAIDLDPATGKVHMSWYKDWERELHYLVRDNDWQENPTVIDIASPRVVGFYEASETDLAIDGDDNVHVIYTTFHPDYTLKYGKKSNNSWQVQTAIEGGEEASIAIDNLSKPHLSFLNTKNGDLEYATITNNIWGSQKIDQFVASGVQSDIAIDGSNNAHVSYSGQGTVLKYGKLVNETWQTEVADNENDTGYQSSITIDSEGHIHIAHVKSSYGGLKYALKGNSGWANTLVDGEGSWLHTTSIALDSNNHPHIAYIAKAADDSLNLRHAWFDGSSWSTETLDDASVNFSNPSISIDDNNHIFISYTGDRWMTDLCLAYFDGSTWHYETLEETGRVGRYPSISLNSNGLPHILSFGFDAVNHTYFTGTFAYPDAPTNLTAEFTGVFNVELNWTDNSDNETGFIIEYLDEDGDFGDSGEWAVRATVGPNISEYQNMASVPGENGYFRVRSFNDTGRSGYSEATAVPSHTPVFPTFDGSSSNLTNQYFAMDFSGPFEMMGYGDLVGYRQYMQGNGTEDVDLAGGGTVASQIITMKGLEGNHPDPDVDPEWYRAFFAQDTSGNVWLLKAYIAEMGETMDFTSSPLLWIPSSPQIGQVVQYSNLSSYCQVTSTTASLPTQLNGKGPFDGLLKLACSDSDDYYAYGEGIVKSVVYDRNKEAGWIEYVSPLEVAGDVNGDLLINLEDTMLVARLLAGKAVSGINSDADVNGDGNIGLAEFVYILNNMTE